MQLRGDRKWNRNRAYRHNAWISGLRIAIRGECKDLKPSKNQGQITVIPLQLDM